MKSTPANRYRTRLWYHFLSSNIPEFDAILKKTVEPQYPPRWRDGSTAINASYLHFQRIENRITGVDPDIATEARRLFDKGPDNIMLWTAFEGDYKRHRDHSHPEITLHISECCNSASHLNNCLKQFSDTAPFDIKAKTLVANSQLGHKLKAAVRVIESLFQSGAAPGILKLDDMISCLLEQAAYLAYDASKLDMEGRVDEVEGLMAAFPKPITIEEAECELSDFFGIGDKESWGNLSLSEQNHTRRAWMDGQTRANAESLIAQLDQKHGI
jgi:hypothetical protein